MGNKRIQGGAQVIKGKLCLHGPLNEVDHVIGLGIVCEGLDLQSHSSTHELKLRNIEMIWACFGMKAQAGHASAAYTWAWLTLLKPGQVVGQSCMLSGWAICIAHLGSHHWLQRLLHSIVADGQMAWRASSTWKALLVCCCPALYTPLMPA